MRYRFRRPRPWDHQAGPPHQRRRRLNAAGGDYSRAESGGDHLLDRFGSDACRLPIEHHLECAERAGHPKAAGPGAIGQGARARASSCGTTVLLLVMRALDGSGQPRVRLSLDAFISIAGDTQTFVTDPNSPCLHRVAHEVGRRLTFEYSSCGLTLWPSSTYTVTIKIASSGRVWRLFLHAPGSRMTT